MDKQSKRLKTQRRAIHAHICDTCPYKCKQEPHVRPMRCQFIDSGGKKP